MTRNATVLLKWLSVEAAVIAGAVIFLAGMGLAVQRGFPLEGYLLAALFLGFIICLQAALYAIWVMIVQVTRRKRMIKKPNAGTSRFMVEAQKQLRSARGTR